MLRPKTSFALVSVPLFLVALQYHMVAVGLADMIADLDAPLRWVGWVITGFTVATAAAQPIAGKLGDQFGSRLVFAGSLALFALASLVCASAPNIWVLIAARFAQGAAGGGLGPTAFAIVAAAYPEQRARAIGLASAMVPIGTLVGPNLGGLLVDHLGWRATFALNVPIGLLLALAAIALLPRSPRRPAGRIDGRGALLLTLAISGIVYSLTALAADSPQWGWVVGSAVAGVVIGVTFVRHELRVEAPMIDVDLLRERAFVVPNIISFVYGAALLGLFGFIPLYVQTVYGMTAAESGLVLTPRAVAMLVISSLAALVLGRTGYRRPMTVGLVVMAIGAVLLGLTIRTPHVFGVEVSDIAWVTIVVTLIGVGYGFVTPALNSVGLDLAPDRVASVTGLRGTFRAVGGATGSAVIVLVISRSADTGRGIEISFFGMAGLCLACLFLVPAVPELTKVP